MTSVDTNVIFAALSVPYARVRRGGRLPRRLIADFLIAAHAEYYDLTVLTFDDTVYKAVFPKVRLFG